MATCDKCFEGWHTRCQRKGKCGCDVCPTLRAIPKPRIRANGTAVPKPRVPKPTKQQRESVAVKYGRLIDIMISTGADHREVARSLNVSRSTIENYLKGNDGQHGQEVC